LPPSPVVGDESESLNPFELVEAGDYAAQRVFPIRDYDGRTIPLPDASVDVVFSSNVPDAQAGGSGRR